MSNAETITSAANPLLQDVRRAVARGGLTSGGVWVAETAQGIIALVRPGQYVIGDLLRDVPLVVVLDGVQDPGNAGTIVRTAEAFGATGAIFVKGSVSPHNPKVLRGSAGSLFRVPHVFGVEPVAARESLDHAGV